MWFLHSFILLAPCPRSQQCVMSGYHPPGPEECQQVGCSCLHCFCGVKFMLLVPPVCGEGLCQLCVIFCREMGYTWDRVGASRPLLGHPCCTWGHLWPLRWDLKMGQRFFLWWFLKIVSNLWPSRGLCPLSGRVAFICRLEPMLDMQRTHNPYPQIYISFPCLRCFPTSLFSEISKKTPKNDRNNNYS